MTDEQARAMEIWEAVWDASNGGYCGIEGCLDCQAAASVIATALAEKDEKIKRLQSDLELTDSDQARIVRECAEAHAKVAEKDAEIAALREALSDAIAIMGHAMNLSATALVAGEVLKAQDVWQKGYNLIFPARSTLAKHGGNNG